MRAHTFKIVLVGDAGVGKSSLIKRHLTGEFHSKYIPTVGVEVHPLVFHTNKGNICLNIWDIAGDDKSSGIRDKYYGGADAAIVMFDIGNKLSLSRIPLWTESLKDLPMVLCGSKCDSMDRKVSYEEILMNNDKNTLYLDVSSKSNYNYEKPFIHLMRLLTGELDLTLEGNPPSLKSMRKKALKKLIRSMEQMVSDMNELMQTFDK